jgi:hypothetical protein
MRLRIQHVVDLMLCSLPKVVVRARWVSWHRMVRIVTGTVRRKAVGNMCQCTRVCRGRSRRMAGRPSLETTAVESVRRGANVVVRRR